ncbi:hypothetical protein JCM8547_004813 [Rhodosporidiobolus lusitaniae]
MPSSANEKEGPCCVCGATTTQRSGSPTSASAGAKSNPFRFPSLTPAEIARAKEYFSTPMISANDRYFTIQSRIHESLGCPFSKCLVAFPFAGCNSPLPPGQLTDEMLDPFWLAAHMSVTLAGHLCDSATLAHSPSHDSHFPFRQKWYVELQHHIVVFGALKLRRALEYKLDPTLVEGRMPKFTQLDEYLQQSALKIIEIARTAGETRASRQWYELVRIGEYALKENLIDSLVEGKTTRLSLPFRNKALCLGRNSLPSAIGGGSLDMQVLYGMKQPEQHPLSAYKSVPLVSMLAGKVGQALEALNPPRKPFPAAEGWYLDLLHRTAVFAGLRYRQRQLDLQAASHSSATSKKQIPADGSILRHLRQVQLNLVGTMLLQDDPDLNSVLGGILLSFSMSVGDTRNVTHFY